MKFREIFRFELAYQLRRAWPWLIFAALVVFAFLMTRDGSLAEALHDDFFLNSPFAVAKTTVTGSLIWLLVAAVVAGEAASRDAATGMHPLTYTAPVSKADYLGGRFLAAFVLNALILLAVQAGILLAVYLPGVDAELIGPFRPAAYLTAYAFIALPNAFVATAIQFSLAARSGRPMASYLGSLLLFFMAYVVSIFLLFQGRQDVANLLDPIGVHFILSELSFLWTPIEKSTRLIELEGTVLTNRLLWLGIALGALAVTYLRFRFAHRTESTWWRRRARRRDAHPPLPVGTRVAAPALSEANVSTPISTPRTPREPALRSEATNGFGVAIQARKTLAIAWTSLRMIAASWAGLALLAAIPALTALVVLDQMESNGVPLVPTTVRVINELTAPLSAELSRWVIIPLLIVFFAGELVWREREAGLGEITDAMPGSEWAPFLGKLLGLGLVLVVFMALLTAAGMLAQVILGYQDFELGLYLKILFGLQLPEYLLFAVLALVVHVLVDQKYVGHLAAIIAYVFIIIAPMFGIEHNLLIYGAGPGWFYTEMRGFGPFLAPWLWFKLYWAAWALLLAAVARLLWVRGRERGLGVRLQLARRRLTRPTALAAAAAAGLILTLGGFIFYNTNVLNEYETASDAAEEAAEYERRYGRYAGIPQPRLTGTSLHVEIYPERREVEIRGSYRLVNRSAEAIDSIHLATVPEVETGAVAFDRTAEPVVADDDLGHRIYALERPLQPGDSLLLDFRVHIEPRGFRESGVDASVVANGTFFASRDWLPAIGYQPNRELTSAADRRAHGLAPRPLIASLYDVEARKDRDGGIAFEAVLGTHEGQVAVAPGALRRTWAEGGRRYFHYSTDDPIGNEYAFFSADYAVHEARWNDPAGAGQAVAIRIFHHPGHTANLDRMLRSIRASLDYYTEQFGPYQYGHLSVVEHPGHGTGMHADPSLISHEEGFSLWTPKDDPGSLDLPFAVVAHEMAHQWTVPYAHVEGAPVMSESLAWYYGMKAVENARGHEHLRRLLSFMRQPYPYPPIRRGEPLLRGLDPYFSYRKGPFALYALSEYIGEERVNGALRSLLEKHRPGEAPLATTLDLYRELQAVTPQSFQPLLHDLFEVNTLWELETERATAEQAQAGAWQVTLDVRARKVVVDEAGVETEVPMDDWVEIGVFAPAEEGDELGAPLYVQMHRIRSGEQTITVTVPRRPFLAGIDPYHLLDVIELEDDDNIEAVELE
jgi:ABC-type transport system involved in multi-copper enzyme maturation permease subunit